jgi:hypothetical protein
MIRMAVRNVFKGRTRAQGMVEFALVLPILLMLILGIIAISHLLFTYFMVVAAGREAARYGVATGLSDHNLPRFRDCDSIRQAAVKVGSIVGVDPTNITVMYDKGPKSDGSAPDMLADSCPAGATGPGYIEIGNRIVVTINITYHTIAPVEFIPEIPITAITRRTIIRTLPIADADVASGSLCTGTITRVVPQAWVTSYSMSKVGQPFTFGAEVIADNPALIAAGTLYLYIDDATYSPTSSYCNVTTGSGISTISCTPKKWTKDQVGEHWIRAMYDPGTHATGSPCYISSKAEPLLHIVEPADTKILPLNIEPKIWQLSGVPFTISVVVETVAPGGGAPEGPVYIWDGSTLLGTISVTKVTGLPRATGSGTFSIKETVSVSHKITAVFDPGVPGLAPGYNESPPESIDYLIDPQPVPVPSPTGGKLLLPSATP